MGASVLFTYDFPHLKSFMIAEKLIESGNLPDMIIAAPHEKLNVYELENKSFLDTGLFFRDSVKGLASDLGIPYIVQKHNSKETQALLNDLSPELGIIGGARILPQSVIDKFSLGLLNAHPGLIPQNRGLYTFHYAILRELPQAITLHLIDRNVDLGKVLRKQIVQIDKNETASSVNKSMLEMQVNMLSELKIDTKAFDEDIHKHSDYLKNEHLTTELEWKAISQYQILRAEYSRILERYYSDH